MSSPEISRTLLVSAIPQHYIEQDATRNGVRYYCRRFPMIEEVTIPKADTIAQMQNAERMEAWRARRKC